MILLLLILASLTAMIIGSYGSYCLRDSRWYFPVLLLCTTALGLTWSLLCWTLNNTTRIALMSVAWDVACVLIYSVIPSYCLLDNPSPLMWIGLALALAGIVCMSCGAQL